VRSVDGRLDLTNVELFNPALTIVDLSGVEYLDGVANTRVIPTPV
jgi:hypothetical protein